MEFIEHLQDTGGTRWPVTGRIQAYVNGARAGFVDFHLSPRGATALIDMIFVERDLRRRGIATALMDALHARHPRLTKFVTPEVLPDGRPFFSRYRREVVRKPRHAK